MIETLFIAIISIAFMIVILTQDEFLPQLLSLIGIIVFSYLFALTLGPGAFMFSAGALGIILGKLTVSEHALIRPWLITLGMVAVIGMVFGLSMHERLVFTISAFVGITTSFSLISFKRFS